MTQISLALRSSSPHSLKHMGDQGASLHCRSRWRHTETSTRLVRLCGGGREEPREIILGVKQWTRIILFPARPCSQVDCHTMCCLTALIFTTGLQMWTLLNNVHWLVKLNQLRISP